MTVFVVSHPETTALQTAVALAAPLGLPVLQDEALGENDRSATGFVPPQEFERLADAFFAHLEVSVREQDARVSELGDRWER